MLPSDYSSQYLEITEQDDVPYIRFKEDRLTEEDNIEQIGYELFALTDQYHCKKLVLNLANLQLLTSSVLGKMITLHRKLHRKDGILVLCNSGDYVTEVLTTSRLLDYFNVAADEAAAKELLAQSDQ